MSITGVESPPKIDLPNLNGLLITIHWARPVLNHAGKLTAADITLTIHTGPDSPRRVVGRILDAQLTEQLISGVRQGRLEKDGFHWVLDEPWEAELAVLNKHAALVD